jgi:hypothetical protein
MDTDRRGTGEKADVTARPIRTPHHQPKPWHSQTSGLAPAAAVAASAAPLIAWLSRSCRFRLRWRRITGRPWRSIPGSRSSERRAKKKTGQSESSRDGEGKAGGPCRGDHQRPRIGAGAGSGAGIGAGAGAGAGAGSGTTTTTAGLANR